MQAAGVLLADRSGRLHVVAASSEATRDLELFQVQRDEGPCLGCYRTGAVVRADDLSAHAAQWPRFVAAAHRKGFASVHAVPLVLDGRVLGALGLFGASAGSLTDDDIDLGQALAHVACVAMIAGDAAGDRDRLNEQLQVALDSRVYIEQAKGALAQHADVSMEEAFTMLRRYSRDRNRKLTDVAQSVVLRTLAVEEVAARHPAPAPADRPAAHPADRPAGG